VRKGAAAWARWRGRERLSCFSHTLAHAHASQSTSISLARFRIDAGRRLRGEAPLLPDFEKALLDIDKARAVNVRTARIACVYAA
jgi:hypothetical protein